MPADHTQKTFQAKTGEIKRDWLVVDATDQVLGRLAQEVAMLLMGKHKPTYTTHVDTGDFVVVLNAGKVRVTGNKGEALDYERFTGYPGGRRVESFNALNQRRPGEPLRIAVKRMLPRNTLGRHMLSKLRLFEGNEHPHQAQQPKAYTIKGRAAL